jgi:hypothetical protein
MTFSIATLSMKGLFVTIGKNRNDTQDNNAAIMLTVSTLSVSFKLSIVILSVIGLSVISTETPWLPMFTNKAPQGLMQRDLFDRVLMSNL